MHAFNCDSCGSPLFFENDTCLSCGRTVGFRPDTLEMCTSETAAAAGFNPCRNWSQHSACNWFVAGAEGSAEYCLACALNELVPDLDDAKRRQLWTDTERAKRRLLFTVLELGLPLLGFGDKQALRFRLLADARVDTGAIEPPPEAPVYTGHQDGCLTLNVVEADDAHRELLRRRLNERYRTMLGHLRHEIGHYYWYALIDGTPLIGAFRELFGDETVDYAAALRRNYETGPAPDWQESYVSAYASAHPWEDFAESWAHYIHIVDTLETANASGVALDGRALPAPLPLRAERPFAAVLQDWRPLAVCLNQLNRSMGMPDAYPFVLTERVQDKLAFVHHVCLAATLGAAARDAATAAAAAASSSTPH